MTVQFAQQAGSSVDVFLYNSKVYYIITDGAGRAADFGSRTGTTVLNAMTASTGLPVVDVADAHLRGPPRAGRDDVIDFAVVGEHVHGNFRLLRELGQVLLDGRLASAMVRAAMGTLAERAQPDRPVRADQVVAADLLERAGAGEGHLNGPILDRLFELILDDLPGFRESQPDQRTVP